MKNTLNMNIAAAGAANCNIGENKNNKVTNAAIAAPAEVNMATNPV